MRKLKRVPEPAGVTRERTVERVGDRVVFTKRTSIPAVVPYAVILACCRVEPDDHHTDPPWEDCDGWEHETDRNYRDRGHWETREKTVRRLVTIQPVPVLGEEMPNPTAEYRDVTEVEEVFVPHYNESDVAGDRWGDRQLVLVSREQAAKWGIYEMVGNGQVSRQVAYERAEAIRRKAIDKLVEWYTDGWQYYGVVCEYLHYDESVWGIDDEEYAERECFDEMARQVARQMEKDGFTVTGVPEPDPEWKRQWQGQKYRQANLMGFETPGDYLRWLKGPPVKSPEVDRG